ncbi:HIT family protein [Lachnospiraceae bacterium OttesenSCG-928-D06]|nr:HIT family protein [Lachnospiraceae bacterium OttesenSCG-928-D06]
MTEKDNCIFCKIIDGRIPSNILYEDDLFKIILDVSPAAKGHAMILPKVHVANLYELPDELSSRILKLAKKMAIHMKKELKCDGVQLVQNNEEAAGQSVFHYHMHIIPRYHDDMQEITWKPGKVTEEELKELMNILRLNSGKEMVPFLDENS